MARGKAQFIRLCLAGVASWIVALGIVYLVGNRPDLAPFLLLTSPLVVLAVVGVILG